MRHIDLDFLELSISDDWKQRAKAAYEEVKKTPPGELRSEKIDDYSNLWKELKAKLKDLSYGKCWYCESAAHRIIGDVDHYRPKNEVKGCADHGGYWWLAFDWRNYRYACELCNRRNTDPMAGKVGGKGSHFPLLDESKRVYDECRPYELLQEEPILLDPTIVTDPLLLTFDVDGSAQPIKSEGDEKLRAETSIILYHLNHYELKERRRHQIFQIVRNKVEDADLYYWQLDQDKKNVAAREGYRRAVRDLKRMINERAEYSAAARAALSMCRTPVRLWINDLLEAS